MGIRAFVAIGLPAAVRREIASLRDRRELGLDRAPLKWVAEENLHVTMKFLGDVEEPVAADALARLRIACAPDEPFEIALSGVGTFPLGTGRPPRVFFVSVTENAELVKRLAAKIDKELQPLGFEPEGQELHPHVTIARVKDGSPRGALPRGPFGAGTALRLRARVDRLALMASRLGPAGPVYSTIGEVPLRGGA